MKTVNPSTTLRVNGERSRTIKFYTLGCKVNQYETQAIREQLQKAGFRELENSRPAEMCVINTCTVTHRADRDSYYLIRRAGRENPGARIVVTGCLTEFDGDKIANIPGVNLIVKNEDKNRIISLLNNSTRNCQLSTVNQSGITYFKSHTRAFLKIQDGCNYRCSYCKVRLVRGKSRSRELSEIEEEVRGLAGNGYREIVLCGVCLGSYGKDLTPRLTLSGLIRKLERIPGDFRIRLSSIELGDITDELIGTLTDSKRLCPHLHIPLQSGDDEILGRMNRQYSSARFMNLIGRLRSSIPEIAITTDVMVGFPGETEKNFRNTVELIKQIQPLRVHMFTYSRRPNTPAYDLGESVPETAIKSRMAQLCQIALSTRQAYCKKFISRIGEVLVERTVCGQPDFWEGYTGTYIKVRIKSRLDLKNKVIKAKLKKICQDFVLAECVK
jgi:threonylcarbamoyladenosine tRNA methylthiotransferase MtaB